MSFAISGLPVETFRPLFGLCDEGLAARGVVRHTAVAGQRFPCRVTLEDAAPGETLLLLNFEDHTAATPYRNAYAIYVREAATKTRQLTDEIPGVLRGRPIALRVFDEAGMLIAADLALADDVNTAIARQFENPAAAYLHAHNAAAGCFVARIDRAS
ncbi:MAG: DUF1203 domain-containing protein [Caulobacterales bacterium]